MQDPGSFDREPETPQAATFVIKRAIKSGDKALAAACLEAVKELRASGTEQPFKEQEWYRRLRGGVNRL